VEYREKGKKGKAVHFAEIDGPASERWLNVIHASAAGGTSKWNYLSLYILDTDTSPIILG
jgi:hypothetical protein